MSKIRNPYVAGQFYPGDTGRLRSEIKAMLANAEALYGEKNELREKVKNINEMNSPYIGVILPHAGYVYSGQTAINTLYAVKDINFTDVMIIAPSHRSMFKGVATVAEYAAFDTPIGFIPVSKQAVQDILSENSPLINDISDVHKYEHSLEVELPLLKELFPDIRLIPFICGDIDESNAQQIGKIIIKYWKPSTLVVISSDFTHYGAAFSYMPFSSNVAENLKKLDGEAIENILKLDLHGFTTYLAKTGATICGSRPIKILLAMANLLKDTKKANWHPWLIEYTTSGELTGDYSHTVSYAGIVLAGETNNTDE